MEPINDHSMRTTRMLIRRIVARIHDLDGALPLSRNQFTIEQKIEYDLLNALVIDVRRMLNELEQ